MKLENLHLRLSLFEYSSLSSFSRNFRTSVPISRLFFLSPSSSNISSLLSNNTRTHPTEFTLPLEPRFELQSELALHVPFSFSLGKVEGGNRCSRCKTAGCTDSFNCGQIGAFYEGIGDRLAFYLAASAAICAGPAGILPFSPPLPTSTDLFYFCLMPLLMYRRVIIMSTDCGRPSPPRHRHE